MYNWHVITFSPWTRFSLSWPHTLSSNDPLDLVLLLLPRPVCCVHAHAAVLPHYSREIWARAVGESCSAGLYPGLCLPKCAEFVHRHMEVSTLIAVHWGSVQARVSQSVWHRRRHLCDCIVCSLNGVDLVWNICTSVILVKLWVCVATTLGSNM